MATLLTKLMFRPQPRKIYNSDTSSHIVSLHPGPSRHQPLFSPLFANTWCLAWFSKRRGHDGVWYVRDVSISISIMFLRYLDPISCHTSVEASSVQRYPPKFQWIFYARLQVFPVFPTRGFVHPPGPRYPAINHTPSLPIHRSSIPITFRHHITPSCPLLPLPNPARQHACF